MSRSARTLSFLIAPACVAVSLGLASPVRSQEAAPAKPAAKKGDNPPEWQDGYTMGRHVAELEQRLERIEKLLAEQAEKERRRNELILQLLRALGSPAAETSALPPLQPGQPQPETPAKTAKPAEVVPATTIEPKDKRFGTVSGVVRAEGEVIDAYVFLDEVVGPVVKDKTLKIDQVNRQFSPRFVAVQKGTRIDFPNRDAIYHNVFSLSANNRFDLGYSRNGDIAPGHRFMTPGKVEVYCNMHSQMSAIVLVLPNDRYAKVAEDGTFSLGRIPTGTRRFLVVASDGRTVHQVTSVEADTIANITFELPRPVPQQAHLNKNGQRYPTQY